MGNIFARNKKDITTSLFYYERVLTVNPNDSIAMNNIGANLMQLGRVNDAELYFEKAFSINSSYPNTLYGLAMVNNLKGYHLKAFGYAIEALKKCKPENPVYNNAFELANQVSLKEIKLIDTTEMFNQYSQKLAIESGKIIDVIQDNTVPTPAKLEIAENHARDRHIIRFKKDRLAIPHLMMHELVHLDLTVQCRRKNTNFLFVATKGHKEQFIRNNEPIIQRLNREGLNDNTISDYMNALFNGINSQIYNTPIDLFIEDFLYQSYPSLRPFQFLSLHSLLKEYIDAAKSKKVAEYTPLSIRNANIILSLIHSFQFRDLFGYDMSYLFKAASSQLSFAKEFYDDYLKYQKNDKAIEAHHLIQKWAKKLRIDNYFSLIEENEYHASRLNVENIVHEPNHLIKAEPELANKSQVDYSNEPAGQATVTMYCLSALQHFEGMARSEIQRVGFEIGQLGRHGIDPSNHDKKYMLKSIQGKEFTGLQLLAYMYVAFQFIDPGLDTGLNFKHEFQSAKEIHEKGKN